MVDTPLSLVGRTMRLLAERLEGQRFLFGPPEGSLAYLEEDPRMVTSVCLSDEGPSVVEAYEIFQRIKRGLGSNRVLCAREGLLADNAAMLVDATDPEAIFALETRCREAAFVTQKTVAIKTDYPPGTWNDSLLHQFTESPTVTITSITTKPALSSAIYASSPATAEGIRAMCNLRRKEEKRHRDSTVECKIAITGRPRR